MRRLRHLLGILQRLFGSLCRESLEICFWISSLTPNTLGIPKHCKQHCRRLPKDVIHSMATGALTPKSPLNVYMLNMLSWGSYQQIIQRNGQETENTCNQFLSLSLYSCRHSHRTRLLNQMFLANPYALSYSAAN